MNPHDTDTPDNTHDDHDAEPTRPLHLGEPSAGTSGPAAPGAAPEPTPGPTPGPTPEPTPAPTPGPTREAAAIDEQPGDGRHPLSISYLVAGLVFLGIAASWGLREVGLVDAGSGSWLFPLTLVVVGSIGLAASVVSSARRP